MRAVSNTSPISALAYIGRLSLLKSQFSEIWIPDAVWDELKLHPDNVAAASIQDAIRANWIRIATAPKSHFLSVLMLHLHKGEAEAIALATNLQANVILIDEQEARRIAVQAGLSVTGVLGVLLRAKLMGEIQFLRPEIQSLRAKARFFIAAHLEAKILSTAGE
jgi:predicted nucleic acid-binding protein